MKLINFLVILVTTSIMSLAKSQGIQITNACTIHPPASFEPYAGMIDSAVYSAVDWNQSIFIALVCKAKDKRGFISKEALRGKIMQMEKDLLADQENPSFWPGSPRKIKHGRALKASVDKEFKGETFSFDLYLVETKTDLLYLYVWTPKVTLREKASTLGTIEHSFFELKR